MSAAKPIAEAEATYQELANESAEQDLLGAILCDNKTYYKVYGILEPRDFAIEAHARIYEAIGKKVEAGQDANPVTLQNLFDHDDALKPVGGARYLAKLLTSTVTILNADYYGKIIADLARRRRMIAAMDDARRDISIISDDRPATTIAAERGEQLMQAGCAGLSSHPPGRVRLIDPRKWQDEPIPQRSWIVPNWVPCGVATGLYGPPGYGKTLIAQQLMTAGARALLWLGQQAMPVGSLGLFCEDDDDELHRRQEAINQSYGIDYSDLGDIRLISRLGYSNTLMTFDRGVGTPTPLWHRIVEEAKDFGAGLVIIDTVADTFGGDQNNMGHARAFVQFCLAGMARAIGPNVAVLATAHPSQAGKSTGSGESGSVQWDAAFRSRLYLDAPPREDGEPNNDDRILTRMKANYARRGETLELEWHNGVLLPKYQATGILGTIERRTCERVFLDLLARLARDNRHVSDNSKAGNYAPRVFAKCPDRERFTEKDFKSAMEGLFFRNSIRIGEYDDGRRRKLSCIYPNTPESQGK